MRYPKNTWRLILSAPSRGAWNMAVDEAVLEAAGKGASPPTLRLYGWAPPCLSLGYAQPLSDVDLMMLAEREWDIVRRPTGGRAILHADELTYAVIGPEAEPRLAGGVLESYQVLSSALLEALHRLNVPAQALSQPPSPPSGGQPASGSGKTKGPVCFDVPSYYEITVGGKKLIGSAQARRLQGFLQHGSLPLFGEITRIVQVLAYPDEAARSQAAERLTAHAATVEAVLGFLPRWEDAVQAFITAFSDVLNIDLELGGLSGKEQARAVELVEQKYANPKWTLHPAKKREAA